MTQMGLNEFVFSLFQSATGSRPPVKGFTITLRHTTVARTPLDEGSASRRDLYLTTHNSHKRHDILATSGIRTRNLNKLVAADPRRGPASCPNILET